MSCKNDKCCDKVSSSPQLTTKVSEHGTTNQMENIIPGNSSVDNLVSNTYLPKDRTSYNPTDCDLKSKSESGDITKATNPKTDPISVNNISTSEFDTTEELK